jgi:hypothetical protein
MSLRTRLSRHAAPVGLAVRGRFDIQHIRDGQVIAERHVDNMVVNAGLAGLAGLTIATGYTNAFDYIAIGTSATAVAAAQTALGSEISTGGGGRALATLSRVTVSTTNDSSRLVKTFTFSGAGFAVKEAGVFGSSSSGTMLARQTFTTINVVATDTLAVTYTVTFARP